MTTPHDATNSQSSAYGSQPGNYGSQPGAYGSQPGAYGSQPGAYGSQPGFGTPAGPPVQGPHPDAAYGDGSALYWKASQDDKTMSVLSHVGAMLVSAIVPLIIFLIKKDESAFIREQTRQSLNLQIMLIIAGFISSILTIVVIGFVLLPIVVVAGWILQIMAAVKAHNGEMYKIPFVIDIIK